MNAINECNTEESNKDILKNIYNKIFSDHY